MSNLRAERTPVEDVTRWIPGNPALREMLACVPPGLRTPTDQSGLGQLMAAGEVADVSVRADAIWVRRSATADWASLAPRVQTALADDLTDFETASEHWLRHPSPTAVPVPSTDEIQQIVNRSAGTIMATHGGSMTVVDVTSTSVTLRADGACSGCGQSDETLLAVIRPAVASHYPAIVEIRLAEDPAPGTVTLLGHKPGWFPVRRSVTKRNGGCH